MSKYKNDPTDYWRVSSDYCVVDNRSALKIGLNESIVLRTLYELCRTKKQNDGISWWQGKQQYWLIKFPWLSEKTLQRVFAKLEKMKLIEIRVDRKTGNHYRPVQEQIEQMLNDDDFRVELIDTINDTASGQNDLMSGQIDLMSGQNDRMSGQIDLTLLSLGSSPLSVPLSDSLPAVKTAGFQEPLVEVLEQLREPKQEKQKTAGSQIFEAYKDAYVQRYKIEPLRNAKTYSICSQIAKQLPLDEALALVHFYVQQNVSYYLQRSHPIQLALGDLQALRTNMLKNKAMSSREAYLADKQQAQKNVLDEYLENREQIQQMFKL